MDNSVHISVRLTPEAARALDRQARDAGQELADFAATVLVEATAASIEDADLRDQLQAEIDLKREVARIAREVSPPGAFDPDVTLKVFRRVRESERLSDLYRKAIGGGTGFERNNGTKARINRTLGAICRVCSGGSSKGPGGGVTMVQVSGEFCFSYTRLFPPAEGEGATIC